MPSPRAFVNAPAHYDRVAKALHWLVVVLLAMQFAVGWTMPEIQADTRPERLIHVHMSLGIGILMIAIVRLLWRLPQAMPAAPQVAAWEQRAGRLVQALLYLLLFAMPLSGWANASARSWTVTFFDMLSLPAISSGDMGHFLGVLHIWAAYGLLSLVGVHSGAALYHHFIVRDRVLLRMISGQE